MQKNKIIFIGLILLSFLLRLSLAYYYSDTFFFRGNSVNQYDIGAISILDKGEIYDNKGSFDLYQHPLNTWFIALCYFVFGRNWFSIAFFQALLNIIQIFLIYKISINIFANKNIAVLSALGMAFYPLTLFLSTTMNDHTLIMFLFTGMLFFLSNLFNQTSNKISNTILAGIFLGLTCLTKSTFLPFIVASLFVFLINFKFKKALLYFFLFGLSTVLTILSYTYRNYKVSDGEFIFITKAESGIATFHLAFNEKVKKCMVNNWTIEWIIWDSTIFIPPDSLKSTSEIGNWHKEKMMNYINRNPIEAGSLILYRFWRFWSPEYYPLFTSKEQKNQFDSGITDVKPDKSDLLRYYTHIIFYTPVLILFIVGIWLSRKEIKKLSLIYIFIFTVMTVHIVLQVLSRQRFIMDPLLMIISSYTVAYCYEKYFVKREINE